MKKFLSIKNTQGIYVARASFSSDETVIDFVNSKSSDNCNFKPVSIVLTPDQVIASSSSSLPTNRIQAIESTHDSISRAESAIVVKSPSKKKLKAKVLKFLHIKKKPKMGDTLNEDAAEARKSDDLPTTSSSYPMLPTPKMARSKGRTAALVKKFSLTPKKSPPKELSAKKSGIPLRTATSVETISHQPQLALQNRMDTATSVSHHSMSEMNLVNIDYRQESSGDNLDVDVKVGQTQYRNYRGGGGNNQSDNISGDVASSSGNLNRAWNTSSNLSIKSGVSLTNNGNNMVSSSGVGASGIVGKVATGRKSASAEKLQITISGKKRTTNTMLDSTADLHRTKQQQSRPLNDIEPKRIERKPFTVQQPPKKFNINHDLTLMNTVGVPPAPTTQAPSAIPTYRAANMSATIKNVVQSSTAIKAQSTMQSQQSVGTSASAANVGQRKSAPVQRADTLVTVTSFDVEDPEDVAAASKFPGQDKDTSLFTEIVEAERRNSFSMDLPSERGRRYPGVAASETIKFAQPSTSSDQSSGGQEVKTSQTEIIPKVIIEEVTSDKRMDKQRKSDKSEPVQEPTEASADKEASEDKNSDATDNELSASATVQSDVATASQPNEGDEAAAASFAAAQSTIQFERRNMSSSPEKREHLYKILVIGELGTGKTSFIKRYVHQFFSQNYRATIGVDFALKVLNWDQNTIIRLQLWDIAGQERFGNMTRVYYKEAVGAFIVFDVTRSPTFDAVIKWKQDLDSKVQLPNGSPIPCILIANKCDQPKQGIVNAPAKMDDYVREHGFAGWFETSAKENINIEEAARALVNKILLNDKIINAGEILDGEKFNLDGSSSERPKKGCSC